MLGSSSLDIISGLKLKLGKFFVVAAFYLFLQVGANADVSQTYPVRPIRLVVPFAAGSSTDITARRFDQHISHSLGQLIVIDNRPGAVGITGSDIVRRASADGYTLLLTAVSSHTLAAALRPNSMPYDVLKDFTPVGRVFTTTNIVVTPLSLPVSNLREMIAHSKKIPGGLSYGSAGNGSTNHLAGEALRLYGANIVHIPFVNISQGITSVISGQIQILIYTASVLPFVKAGKLKALAVVSDKRHPQCPEVPTIVEQGFPEAVAQGWSGFFAPTGLPGAIRDRFFIALRDAMNDPEILRGYESAGQEHALMDPKEFSEFLVKDLSRWKNVIKRANIPTD